MIHYHGTPVSGPRQDVARFLQGRHALVPYPRRDDMGPVADFCQSFIFDNGAFSAWRKGRPVTDWTPYYQWCEEWRRHPGFDWALIPDVITGDEAENDALVAEWPPHIRGVPVWHLHEGIERLVRLGHEWDTVALGSSGEWKTPGTPEWRERMHDAMAALCDAQGRPPCRLHGLRMLNPRIFKNLPLSSADSTNAAVNANGQRWDGPYAPASAWQRATVIADRVEAHNSAAFYNFAKDLL